MSTKAGSANVRGRDATNPTGAEATNNASKKHYVRQMTDRRREQNRKAQKVYRERIRKRLEDLEEQAASSGPIGRVLDGHGSVPSSSSPAKDTPQAVMSTNKDSTYLDTPASMPAPARTSPVSRASPAGTRTIDLADAFVAAGDLPMGNNSFAMPFLIGQTPEPDPEPELDHHHHIDHTHEDYGDLDLRAIWKLPPSARTQQYTPTYQKQSMTPMSVSSTRPFNRSNPFPLPDPFTNNLRITMINNIEASLAIGLAIGISRTAYIQDHPSRFPGCYVALNSSSPKTLTYAFFQDQVMTVTPLLQEHISSVKGALRPSPSQLTSPHPSYLDCIVFPHFRDLAVRASAEGILDHVSLFTDLMNGGLVCWGNASDASMSSRRRRKRHMDDMVAWSTRSWEAKKWFLKKWAWLIGTEDDERERGDTEGIWLGSRWWWQMRGEIDSEDDDDDGSGSDGEADEVGYDGVGQDSSRVQELSQVQRQAAGGTVIPCSAPTPTST